MSLVPSTAVISPLLGLCVGLRIISTTDDWALKKGYVEVLDSSLKDYEEFTLCGRFQTYQFRSAPEDENQMIISIENYYMLGSYIALPCGDICTGYYKAKVGSDWKYKKVFGFSEFCSEDFYSYFPSWLPWVWSTVCISASKSQGYMEVNINGEKVGETERYNGYYQDVNTNIFLMNLKEV